MSTTYCLYVILNKETNEVLYSGADENELYTRLYLLYNGKVKPLTIRRGINGNAIINGVERCDLGFDCYGRELVLSFVSYESVESFYLNLNEFIYEKQYNK